MPTKKNKPTPTRVPGIVKDGPERYLVRARWTDPKTGKRRKREAIATSMDEAIRLQQALKGRAAEATTRSTRPRFADYAEQWLQSHAGDLSPSTRERYVGELANVVVVLGEQFVDSIDERDIQKWRDEMQAKGLASTTINAIHRTLRVALDPLVRQGVLGRNPARDVRALRERRTTGARSTSLSADQLRAVMDAVECLTTRGQLTPDIGRMLQTLAWTGMRKGELLALRWKDYRDGELWLSRAVCKVTRTSKPTKTDDPRVVPVAAPLARVLDEQRRWLLTSQHPGLASGLVFPADPSHAERARVKRGDQDAFWFRTDSVLDKPLRRVVAEAGVPRITPHSFRRTYENLLRQSGVDDLVRRSVAGWRTNQAQEIYAGIAPEERAAAARRLEAMVTGSAPARTGTPTGTPEGRTSIEDISLKGDSPDMSGI